MLGAKTGGRVGHGAIGEVTEGLVKRGIKAVSEGMSKAVADFHRGTAEGLKKVAAQTKAADERAAKGFNDLPHRHDVPSPGSAGLKTDLRGVDRGDGRDSSGHFTGAGGYGKSGEAQGLTVYERLTGLKPVGQQVRVTTGNGSTRLYDGLALKSDGTYEGVEVKSGSASRNPAQRAFDASVTAGTPATGILNGKSIKVTSVWLIQVVE
jgi:hypothetical protein